MSVAAERVTAEIASQVRAERAHRRWTLDELSARSGVSRRLLVQIEHAEANPSLATLLKLAAALGVTLTELLSEESAAEPVAVVSGQRAMTLWSTGAGSTARLLVSHGPLELWSWTLTPGGRRSSEPHRPGSLELLSVQTGSVELDVGNHRVEVRAGDSAWFDATRPHAYINSGTAPATFALVAPGDGGERGGRDRLASSRTRASASGASWQAAKRVGDRAELNRAGSRSQRPARRQLATCSALSASSARAKPTRSSTRWSATR